LDCIINENEIEEENEFLDSMTDTNSDYIGDSEDNDSDEKEMNLLHENLVFLEKSNQLKF